MGLVVVEALLKHGGGLNGRIVFESVVDEECNGGGAGTLACCEAGITGDVAICLDGGPRRGRQRLQTASPRSACAPRADRATPPPATR